MTHKVRVSMTPDRFIEVDDAEFKDLTRQGLVIEEEITAYEAKTDDGKTPTKQHDGDSKDSEGGK